MNRVRKPKIHVLPGAFDEKHGYCAKLVSFEEYEDLQFAFEQERIAHVALLTTVKKRSDASAIIGAAHDLAVKLGAVQ